MNSDITFKCEECGNRYARKDGLKRHLRKCIFGDVHLFECEICGADFTSKSLMRRHKSAVHENITFQCDRCKRSFTRKDVLKYHIERCQFKRKSSSRLYQCDVCGSKYKFKSSMKRHKETTHGRESLNFNGNFECDKCNRRFSRKDVLKRHIERSHMKNEFPPFQYQCEICGKKFVIKERLQRHCAIHLITNDSKCVECYDFFPNTRSILQRMKRIPVTETNHEHLSFPTMGDFYLWKQNMEKLTFTSYRKRAATKSKKYTVYRFVCHRSGTYVLKHYDRKRSAKLYGSKKVGTFCPAEICVRIEDKIGSCKVFYMKTHLGHDICNTAEELHHIYVKRKVRDLRLSEIALSIPLDGILDDNVDSTNYTCKVEKKSLLSGKVISKPQSSDPTCVDGFIFLHSSSIIYYKKQNEIDDKFPSLSAEDIVIIIMTDSQKQLLQKYGEIAVLMDSIHGLKYNFLVHTLSVMDDNHEGIEVAAAVSNRNDETLASILFHCIKETASCIMTRTFVTDIQENYYTSWRTIMSEPQYTLFYFWHVREDWHRNLNKIPTLRKRNYVRNKLYKLSSTFDEKDFVTELTSFLDDEDPELRSFIVYFNTFYVKNVTSWAYCYRKDAHINTNIKAEGFRSTLKKVIRKQCIHEKIPLNICLEALNKFLQFKNKPLLQRAFKSRIPYKLCILRRNHKLIENKKYTMTVCGDSYEGWNITFSFADKNKTDVHFICLSKENCQKCRLYCTECETCVHQYYCSCLDNTIRFNMCIHIHALCTSLRNTNSSKEPLPPLIYKEIETPTYYLVESGEYDVESVEESCFEPVEEIIEEKVGSPTIEAVKEELRGTLNNLCDSLENVEDAEMLLTMVNSWRVKRESKNFIDTD